MSDALLLERARQAAEHVLAAYDDFKKRPTYGTAQVLQRAKRDRDALWARWPLKEVS